MAADRGRPGARHAYVHVPFCSRRCSYCDFAIAVRREVPVDEFSTAIVTEIRLRSGEFGAPLDTLYLGGGTPSKLGGAGVAGLIGRLADNGVVLAPGAELTVEANPEDVSPAAVEAWLAAGVNRLSVGIQTFAPAALDWMHRTHTAETAAESVRAARTAGLSNVSIDLIYALPAFLERDWRADLNRALEISPDHISLYGLTVEPRTPLGKWTARGDVVPQGEDQAAEEFLAAHAVLTGAGYEHYEVSNYGRPGRRSVHNSSYWTRVPYVGLGPSAHSFDGARRRWNVAAYAAWIEALRAERDPVAGEEVLQRDEAVAEEAYLGLRTDAGVPVQTPAQRAAAAAWESEGWARVERGRVRLTPEGWLRLDALAAAFP